ncbi:MAG: hypothetical protein ACJAT2_002581 [Bacteriovoracaceae bacterium]|jgi:uncharacterized protein YbaA (DUF1428 family)
MKGNYVDGFLIPVPENKLGEYEELAQRMAKVFKELGALEYVECIADDVKPGKVTSFPQAVLAESNEKVIFAWITYESKESRDEVQKKFMEHPIMKEMSPDAMPFDGMRMIMGGFKTLINC